ncbi:mRNA splicing protein [Lecanicillium sp. MT-2017a]|nr:mRNA splicing protein [Lecanicillium sp. MT-2017a]
MDGKTALLLTPLVSSTCTVLFAFDQHSFLEPFTRRACYRRSNDLLPSYMKIFSPRCLAQVMSFLGVTTWSSAAALYACRALLRAKGSTRWYGAAAAMACAHLLYVPLVASKARAIMDDDGVAVEDEGSTNADILCSWLKVNVARTVTTDLVGWVCAFVAVGKTFSPAI